LRNIVQDHRLNHRVNLISGVLEEESSELLKVFFRRLREKNK
jgi:tRNA(adenine34) deaminase